MKGRRRRYLASQLMTLHQQWLRNIACSEATLEQGEAEEGKNVQEGRSSVFLQPYGRVPLAFAELVGKMKQVESERIDHSATAVPISSPTLMSSTQLPQDHENIPSTSPHESSLSSLLEEFLDGAGAVRLLSHPFLVTKTEKESVHPPLPLCRRNRDGATPAEEGSRLHSQEDNRNHASSIKVSDRKRRKERSGRPFRLSLSRYYCAICAEGSEPCDDARRWLSECSLRIPEEEDHEDHIVTVNGRQQSKKSRAYACLTQPLHVFRSLLQISLILESKRGSARLRWVTEQYPGVRDRILEFLCGTEEQQPSSRSHRCHFNEDEKDLRAREEGETWRDDVPAVPVSPPPSRLHYVPLPPVTAHDEWEEMIYWMGFDAIRDNKTRIITDFSRHWKRRTIPYDQFVFFYSFRDHQPPTPVLNIVTRSVKPGMAAMLRMNLVSLQLLHHHEFFIPEDHYWDVFPYLEDAAVAATREKLGLTDDKENKQEEKEGTSVSQNAHSYKGDHNCGSPEELCSKMRHIGLYLSATQKHLSLFSPVKKNVLMERGRDKQYVWEHA